MANIMALSFKEDMSHPCRTCHIDVSESDRDKAEKGSDISGKTRFRYIAANRAPAMRSNPIRMGREPTFFTTVHSSGKAWQMSTMMAMIVACRKVSSIVIITAKAAYVVTVAPVRNAMDEAPGRPMWQNNGFSHWAHQAITP